MIGQLPRDTEAVFPQRFSLFQLVLFLPQPKRITLIKMKGRTRVFVNRFGLHPVTDNR